MLVAIQARLGSKRLPMKVLLPGPGGKPLIQYMYEKYKMLGDPFVICPDKDYEVFCRMHLGVFGFDGHEDDCIGRLAAFVEDYHDEEYVGVVLGDSPEASPMTMVRARKFLEEEPEAKGAHVALPLGMQNFVLRVSYVRELAEKLTGADREHYTGWMVKQPYWARIAPNDDYSIDTEEDWMRWAT